MRHKRVYEKVYQISSKEYLNVFSNGLDLDDMLSNLYCELEDASGEPIGVKINWNDLNQNLQDKIIESITLELAGA